MHKHPLKKNTFYNQLQNIVNHICKHNLINIIGDFGARITKPSDIEQDYTGSFYFHGTNNDYELFSKK